MIVRIWVTVVDWPADAWISPASTDPTPAATATHPSHRGYSRLHATARP
jgi:hypothetical protein